MKKDGSQNHYEQGRCSLLLMLCLVALALASRTAMGQVDQGAITGIVQDSSRAIVPNARVTVTNIDTGLVLQGTTNGRGVYVFSPLKIGNYTLSATAQRFQTTKHENLPLAAQQSMYVVVVFTPSAVSHT